MKCVHYIMQDFTFTSNIIKFPNHMMFLSFDSKRRMSAVEQDLLTLPEHRRVPLFSVGFVLLNL